MGRKFTDEDHADYYATGFTDEDFELELLADDSLSDETVDVIMSDVIDGEGFDDI